MSKPIYIFGHQNPDTDSICSAIAYANLKKLLGYDNYVAGRLGEITDETKYVLDYFNVEPPELIKNLKPQVSDLNLECCVVARETDSVKKVLQSIVTEVGRSIPVVDKNERLIGITSISDIVPNYIGLSGKSMLKDANTPFQNIIEEINAHTIIGEYEADSILGDIHLYCELNKEEQISKEDIVVLDYHNEYKYLYTTGAGCIILCNYDDDKEIIKSDTFDGIILATNHSVYEIIKMITRSVPVASMVKKDQLEYFTTYETIDDVKNNMITSKHSVFPVVDEWGYIQGMISKGNLMDLDRKKVILVDHNENSQSVPGIEETEILEVIDHHRVANVQTITPLYFRTEPLGCTCTIIAKMYEENNIKINKQMAGIMLSAILSDTLIFKSPTCTEEDKAIARRLAKIADVDIMKYGMNMIISGSSLGDETPESIIKTDMKKFTFGNYKVMISQINTGDFEGFYAMFDDIKHTMEQMCEEEEFDLAVLLITNIIIGGTELLVIGKERWIAENAFKMEKEDVSIFLPGVFSRKKQVVPQLMKAAHL